MPEGPEIAKVVDSLQFMRGHTIESLYLSTSRPWILKMSPSDVLHDKITNISRVGKFIIWEHLSERRTIIHLSFTGTFSQKVQKFFAMQLTLEDGTKVNFADKRGLSIWRNVSKEEFEADSTLRAHKVDGLSSSTQEIFSRLVALNKKGIKKELKPFLLDYHNICGIGNIYGSEICFEAKLSPKKRFCDLDEEELKRLTQTISFILKRAYQLGGSSIETFSDYLDNEGHAQDLHKVYSKEVCQLCGTRILSFKQDGRTTYYCPCCQGGK